MLCFCVIDLARECGGKQGLEIFCGTSCRVLCSAVQGQTGFFRPEVRAEPWPPLLWDCVAGVMPPCLSHLLSLSVWLGALLPSQRKLLQSSRKI